MIIISKLLPVINRLFICIVICLIASAKSSVAQLPASALKWEISGFTNTETLEYVSLPSWFETDSLMIKWVQKNGSLVYEFSVAGSTGTWHDLSADGEFIAHVLFRGLAGSIRFARQQGAVSIEPAIMKDGRNMLPYVFKVSSVLTR